MEPVDCAPDVRLMRTLLLLVTECSVSRTAEILGQTRPTVSYLKTRRYFQQHSPRITQTGDEAVANA